MSFLLAVLNSYLNDLQLFFSFVCCSSNVLFEVVRHRKTTSQVLPTRPSI